MTKMNKEILKLQKKCMGLLSMVKLHVELMGNQKDERETKNFVPKTDKENLELIAGAENDSITDTRIVTEKIMKNGIQMSYNTHQKVDESKNYTDLSYSPSFT